MPETRAIDVMNSALGHGFNRSRPPTVLCAGPSEYDHQSLREILGAIGWELLSVRTAREAWARLRSESLPVLISERELPDGNWQQLLGYASHVPQPPRVIVSSRLADASLWAEALNLGAFDLLSVPFDRKEVWLVLTHAWRSWHQQWSAEAPHRPRRPAASVAD